MVYLTRSTIHLLEFYLLIRAINISILSASGEEADKDLLVKDLRWSVYGISYQIYNTSPRILSAYQSH